MSRAFLPLTASLVALSLSAFAGCSDPPQGRGFADGAQDDGGAATTDGGGGSGGGEDGGPTTENKGCGAYTEALDDPKADVSGVAFNGEAVQPFVLGVLEKRYPHGKTLVEGGLKLTSQGSCIDRYLRDKSSARSVMGQLSVVVHECGHFHDLNESKGGSSSYLLAPGKTLVCERGDTTDRGGKTFARSRIMKDAYAAKRKACGGTVARGCDLYADIYLNGDPDDKEFDSGDQGYSLLLEEANQYVNSIATGRAIEGEMSNVASERDGILTFQWYLARYLKMARESYPETYALLSQDACWRDATLTIYDRGTFYLEATKGSQKLQIDADAIEKLRDEPELVAEIDALRKLQGCP